MAAFPKVLNKEHLIIEVENKISPCSKIDFLICFGRIISLKQDTLVLQT